MVLDFTKERVEERETKVEKASDIGSLSNNLDSLTETLRKFENDVTKLHSEVFRIETSKAERETERPAEAPKNKITELIDKVDACSDVQRKIADKFNDFKNLLC